VKIFCGGYVDKFLPIEYIKSTTPIEVERWKVEGGEKRGKEFGGGKPFLIGVRY
jgi:hypothetical protein